MSQTLALRKRHARWRVDLAIHEALQRARDQNAEMTLEALIASVRTHSTLLCTAPIGGYAAWRHVPRILRGLLALNSHRKHWLRDPWEWSARGPSQLGQFASLALHLLGTHPVPAFMAHVWFEEAGERADVHRKLYRHLALGNSIRGADLPLKLTRPMAVLFGQAPDHFSVEQALRWSQVRSLRGSRQLASLVATTRLGSCFEDGEFWRRALSVLIAQPRLENGLVPALIELLFVRRGGFRARLLRVRTEHDFHRIQEDVRRWAEWEEQRHRVPKLAWPATSIRGFNWHDPATDPWSHRHWTIRELLDRDALIEEGKAHRHCVGTYAEDCARRMTSIWSMQCHGALESHRVLTIEVDPQDRRIKTARGFCNRRPQKRHFAVLSRWAAEADLKIDTRVGRFVR